MIPLGSRLVVKPLAKEQETKSGLIIPDTSKQEKPMQGEVVSVGVEVKEKKLKKGVKIIFAKYSPVEVGELLIIEENEPDSKSITS